MEDAREPMDYEMDDYAVPSDIVSLSVRDWKPTSDFLVGLLDGEEFNK